MNSVNTICADFTKESSPVLKSLPEPIKLDPSQTALIVVDMQNAYASQGGYLDLCGFDVTSTKPVIDKINAAVDISHQSGIQVIYFRNGWDNKYVEAGGS